MNGRILTYRVQLNVYGQRILGQDEGSYWSFSPKAKSENMQEEHCCSVTVHMESMGHQILSNLNYPEETMTNFCQPTSPKPSSFPLNLIK